MDGERLSDLRKDRNLTQKELAKVLGISENSVSLYERNINTPDDQLKVKIAKYFNVSLDYLLGAIDHQQPLERTRAFFVFSENMPANAAAEIHSFLNYLKSKYNI